MYWYTIGQTLTQQEHAPAPEQPAVVLLTSEELSHQPALPGLERTLHHTPPARDARVCKAEVYPVSLFVTAIRINSTQVRPSTVQVSILPSTGIIFPLLAL